MSSRRRDFDWNQERFGIATRGLNEENKTGRLGVVLGASLGQGSASLLRHLPTMDHVGVAGSGATYTAD